MQVHYCVGRLLWQRLPCAHLKFISWAPSVTPLQSGVAMRLNCSQWHVSSCTVCHFLPWPVSEYKLLSHVQFFATPWTVACQSPLSMGFSRQEYWSGLPCPLPRDLPDPGIEPWSHILHVDSLPSEPPRKPLAHKNL